MPALGERAKGSQSSVLNGWALGRESMGRRSKGGLLGRTLAVVGTGTVVINA